MKRRSLSIALAVACLFVWVPAASAALPPLPVSFAGAQVIPVGGGPCSVAVGDLNGDGLPDLAAANSGSSNVSVMLGDGSGGFGGATNYDTHGSAKAVAIGDLNGDGKPDLVTANGGTYNDVSVLLGNGDGTFAPRFDFFLGTAFAPLGIAVGDFNGDGKLDVVTANAGAGGNSVSVLLGDGNGGFSAQYDHAVGTGARSVAVGDFNGDGKLDVAAANYNAATVSVLLGNGSGGFSARFDHSVGFFPKSVAVGDFNGDNEGDLAVANSTSDSVSILRGDGSGGFAASVNYAVAGGPSSVAVGDFNGDGNTDLAVAASGVSILIGNGIGGFSAIVNYGAGASASSVAIGDFNADGKADLAAGGWGDTVSVLRGAGDGSFLQVSDHAVGSHPESVAATASNGAAADFNGDGKADLAVANSNAATVSILLGDGNGGFDPKTDFGVGSGPYSIAVDDFNGDGHQDMAVANESGASVSVLLGNGSGGFATAVDHTVGTDPYSDPYSVAVADFNGDGKLDLAVACGYPGSVAVLLGDGSGGFATAVDHPVSASPRSVAVGDFNGDGKKDLAVAPSASGVSVLLGDGSGGFAAPVDHSIGAGLPESVAVGDFNGDGKDDLAVTTAGFGPTSYLVWILLNDGSGGFAAAVDYPVGAYPYSVADFNGDGKLDLATANLESDTASIVLGKGDGTFAAPTDYAVGSGPRSVAVADFNGDGKPDLAAADYKADTVSVLLNITQPVIGITRIDAGVAYTTSATATLDSTITGAAEMRFRDAGGTWTSWEGYAATKSWSLPAIDGTKTVEAEYRDAALHVLARSAHIFLDTTKPITTDNAPAIWVNHAVTVTLTPGDAGGSGIAYTEYSLDMGATWTKGTSVTHPPPTGHYPDGVVTVRYRSADKAGNVEATKTCTIKVDRRKPTTKAPYAATARRGHTAYLKFKVTDPRPGSPTATVTIKVRNPAGTVVKTLTLASAKPVNTLLTTRFTLPRTWRTGTYKFYVYATDQAGNKQTLPVGSNKLIVR
jgi:hypothetical protein